MDKKENQIPAIEYFLTNPRENFQIIDFEEERKKPVFMSIDEFAARIDKYSMFDFLQTVCAVR